MKATRHLTNQERRIVEARFADQPWVAGRPNSVELLRQRLSIRRTGPGSFIAVGPDGKTRGNYAPLWSVLSTIASGRVSA